MSDKVTKTKEQWQAQLSSEQYAVCREKATERPFSEKFDRANAKGTYTCVCCGQEVFTSTTKFDAGCGWPSFGAPVDNDRIDQHSDSAHGMIRTEVTCSRCDSHLGHVFDDGPQPTGLRYCINSVSLDFKDE